MTVEDLIRRRGGRVTVQRRLVLEALSRARHHTTEEQIAEYVRARVPEIDVSTVYRNLEALEKVGAVTHTHLDGRVTRWHRADVEAHGHLVCRECGREEEVPLSVLEPLARRLRTRSGFRADLAHSAVAGICAQCSTVSS